MEAQKPDYSELIKHTKKFKKSLTVSNTVEISAGIFVLGIFTFYVYLFREAPILVPAGCVLVVLGGSYIIHYIFRHRRRKGEVPPEEDLVSYFQYWHKWYSNTYSMGRRIFWWYILPVLPGLIILLIGRVQMDPEKLQDALTVNIPLLLVVCGGVFWLNRYYSAGKIHVKIVELEEAIETLQAPSNPEVDGVD